MDNDTDNDIGNALQTGYRATDVLIEVYDHMPNPQPFYLEVGEERLRIRKGLVGIGLAILGTIGCCFSDDRRTQELSAFITGAGLKLMEDDISNVQDWFSFK